MTIRVLVGLLLSLAAVARAQSYSIVIIDPILSPNFTRATGLSNSGVFLGRTHSVGGGTVLSFTWQGGNVSFINPPPWAFAATATSIAENGTVVGDASLGSVESVESSGFKYRGGTYTRLDPLPGLASVSIRRVNARGEVVGVSADWKFPKRTRATMWIGAKPTKLVEPPPGHYSQALDLSDDGRVIGSSGDPFAGGGITWLWSEGKAVAAPMPAGCSEAYYAKFAGKGILGTGVRQGQGVLLRWTEKAAAEVAALPSALSGVVDTNSLGQALVVCQDPVTAERTTYLWKGGALIDLDSVVNPAPSFKGCFFVTINDSGWIAGDGFVGGGTTRRAFLLIPNP